MKKNLHTVFAASAVGLCLMAAGCEKKPAAAAASAPADLRGAPINPVAEVRGEPIAKPTPTPKPEPAVAAQTEEAAVAEAATTAEAAETAAVEAVASVMEAAQPPKNLSTAEDKPIRIKVASETKQGVVPMVAPELDSSETGAPVIAANVSEGAEPAVPVSFNPIKLAKAAELVKSPVAVAAEAMAAKVNEIEETGAAESVKAVKGEETVESVGEAIVADATEEVVATAIEAAAKAAPPDEGSVEPKMIGVFFEVTFDQLASFEYEMPDEFGDPDEEPEDLEPGDGAGGADEGPAAEAGPAVGPATAETAKAEEEDQIPASVRKFNKKRVALEGFMLPLKVEDGLVTELLVMRDQSMCCFGSVPKINEWVSVRMTGKGVDPVMDEPVTLYGTLKVGEVRENGYLVGIYEMDGERLGARIDY